MFADFGAARFTGSGQIPVPRVQKIEESPNSRRSILVAAENTPESFVTHGNGGKEQVSRSVVIFLLLVIDVLQLTAVVLLKGQIAAGVLVQLFAYGRPLTEQIRLDSKKQHNQPSATRGSDRSQPRWQKDNV